ncbi:hypothetical protein [Geodermatophilus sp. URMC 64]
MSIDELRELVSTLQPYVGAGLPGAAATRLRVAVEIERLERRAAGSGDGIHRHVPLPRSG